MVVATSTADNHIWAFSAATGTLRWEVSTLSNPTKGTIYNGNYYFGHQDLTTGRTIYSSVVA